MVISSKPLKCSFFILFLLVFANYSHAQAPGLTGKRFLIGVEVPMIVNGIFSSDNSYRYYDYSTSKGLSVTSEETDGLAFRIKPTLTLEYILNRKTSFQAVVRYFNPSVNLSTFADTVITGGVSSQVYFNPTEKAKMRHIVVGGKFKFFGGSNINPLGFYGYVGAEYYMQSIKFAENNFIALDNNGAPIYKNPTQTKSSNLLVTFGFGRQYTYGSKVLMNLGLDVGLPITNTGYSKLEYNAINYTDKKSNQEVWNYAFNVNIGFSIAP
jgi:hypothetical protein